MLRARSVLSFSIVRTEPPPRLVAAYFRLFVRIGNNAKFRDKRGEFQKWSLVLDGNPHGGMSVVRFRQVIRRNTAPSALPYKLAPESRVQFASPGLQTGSNVCTFPVTFPHVPKVFLLRTQTL